MASRWHPWRRCLPTMTAVRNVAAYIAALEPGSIANSTGLAIPIAGHLITPAAAPAMVRRGSGQLCLTGPQACRDKTTGT